MLPHFSIVIPCYNEARRLPDTLPRLADFLTTIKIDHEVILVVEKSPDTTLELARTFASAHPSWRVIDNEVHRGKGYAVRSGMLSAKGDFICFMDADLSSDPSAISSALALLETHPEIAIIAGDRRNPESIVVQNPGRSRPARSATFNRLVRFLFPYIETHDTQCGFKMFRASAARDIFSHARINGFAFDVEIFQIAHRLGHSVCMLPVRWTDAPHSTVRAIRHSAQMLRDVLRLRSG